MRLVDLVRSITWAECKAALVSLFPNEQLDLLAYQTVLGHLRTIEPVTTEMRIRVNMCAEGEADTALITNH